MGKVFDGIQRPLELFQEKSGAFIPRGISMPGIDLEKMWHFVPQIKAGEEVSFQNKLGEVKETQSIITVSYTHRDVYKRQSL